MAEQLKESALRALEETYTNDTQLDGQLIEDFITTANVIDETVLHDFLPWIDKILHKPNYYELDRNEVLLKLLRKLLTEVSFEQILPYYSRDFIINSLQLKSDLNPTVALLCLSIINSNINDPIVISFISENGVLQSLISNYLTLSSLDISIVNQIELLINLIIIDGIETLSNILFSLELVNLYSLTRNNENTTLIARLLDYLLILFPIFSKNTKLLPTSLYVFTIADIDNFKHDPLFLILLVEFYIKLVRQLQAGEILQSIHPTISDLVHGYINNEIDDLVKSEIVNLLVALSYGDLEDYTKQLIVETKLFKAYNLLGLYEYEENSIKLLSEFNPNLIVSANGEIYEDVLSNLSLLSNKLLFPILLNFIESPTIFDKFIEPYLNSSTLSVIPKDKLLQIVFQMSKFTHSKKYLFNDLPNIISSSLLENESINNDIWRLKIEILQNLLLQDDQLKEEIEFWKNDLETQYNLMKYGRSLKRVIPQVDVLDETL